MRKRSLQSRFRAWFRFFGRRDCPYSVAHPDSHNVVAVGAERIAQFHEVDRIMTGAPGFRLGPFALLDLIGSDISVAAMESIWGQFFGEPMYATGPELKLRVTGGLYGSEERTRLVCLRGQQARGAADARSRRQDCRASSG